MSDEMNHLGRLIALWEKKLRYAQARNDSSGIAVAEWYLCRWWAQVAATVG